MITDEILLLYHLDDGLDASVREAVETTLARDAVLRERLARIVADLNELTATAPAPAAAPDDTRRRWHAALERAAASSATAATSPTSAPANTKPAASGRAWFLQWPAFGALATGVLAAVIGVRLLMPAGQMPPATDPPGTTVAQAPGDNNLRFEHSVRLYLIEARRQVETLGNLPQAEREQVLNLVITHNQMYIAAAERAASPAVARSLRALNPVLETLDETGDRATFAGGLAQVDFEMKVIQARLAQRAPIADRNRLQLLAL